MNVTEMLERIEKLPSEWRHPDPLGGDASHVVDLHLRHIAEKLAERGWMIYLGAERWNVCDDTDDFVLNRNTYVEAAISAAEECNKQ